MPQSKANVERIKRRLLQDLVQQNVELIHGRAARRPAPRRFPYLRLLLLTSALALLVLSTAVIGSPRLLSTLAAAPAAPSGQPPARLAVAALPAQLSSPAPPAGAGAATSAAPAVLPAVLPATVIDPAVLPLAVRKIAIDAGHGGDSQGTRTALGLLEKDVTLDVARRLRRLLEEQRGFEVIMTRQDDTAVSLADRAAVANRLGADIFVSVHVNWIGDRSSRGIETYYLGPTNDPNLNHLAALENRDSGYSMADMRQLLDGIYAGVRQDKSRRLAEVVQGALFRSLAKVNPKIEDRGVKSAPFIVLLSTRMPAILAEVSCLSNAEEARLLASPPYRQHIAEALAGGLRAYASLAGGGAAGDGG
ncbi:MAG TPA: N-acetylmuramoyl-L-alanine amidase [Thermoanaerobaculia bacterium]|jgi:N-acetylmuramoyl-L-alanine amidase|nr:N-acetylmuramoyl-L-alanine amidase [Thermoanaerobaculia bacterium]